MTTNFVRTRPFIISPAKDSIRNKIVDFSDFRSNYISIYIKKSRAEDHINFSMNLNTLIVTKGLAKLFDT